MIGVHKSLFANVLLALRIANLAIKFPHLFVSGFDEIPVIIFTKVRNFRVQVNPERLVLLEVLPDQFNLAEKNPLEMFDGAV